MPDHVCDEGGGRIVASVSLSKGTGDATTRLGVSFDRIGRDKAIAVMLILCNIRPRYSPFILNLWMPSHDYQLFANTSSTEYLGRLYAKSQSPVTRAVSPGPSLA